MVPSSFNSTIKKPPVRTDNVELTCFIAPITISTLPSPSISATPSIDSPKSASYDIDVFKLPEVFDIF